MSTWIFEATGSSEDPDRSQLPTGSGIKSSRMCGVKDEYKRGTHVPNIKPETKREVELEAIYKLRGA